MVLPIREMNAFGYSVKEEASRSDGNFLKFPPKFGSNFKHPNNPFSHRGP